MQGSKWVRTSSQGADLLHWSPERRQSQSNCARGRATNPPTLAFPPPFLLWSKPRGCSLCTPELGWCWKFWCVLKQERNRGLYCLHSGVGRSLTLALEKPSRSLHGCWLCSPNQLADGQEDLFPKKLPLGSSQGERTRIQKAQHKSLKNFNTLAFVPKCAFLTLITGDQHILHLPIDFCLIYKLLSLPECAPQPHTLCVEHRGPINSAWHKFSQWSDVLHRAIVHKPLFVKKQTKGECWRYFYMILFWFLKMWDNE